ncbi:MAG: fibronectin type III domain-containing protein [Bacteroidales bacterium]|nr:fibronectin type III domain-containing protein [Bacteroidales bacterium]
MALILDNAFTNDTYDRRSDRVSLMTNNIESNSVELGISETLLSWGTSVDNKWSTARVSAGVERGERDVAFETYLNKFDETKSLLIDIKEVLLALIGDVEEGKEIIDEYGIGGATPRNRSGVKQLIDQIVETSNRLRTAGDSRVLPEVLVTKLAEAGDETVNLWHQAQKEKQDSAEAYDALDALFNEDSQKLRLIYQMAKLIWGAYSPKLTLLGFAPSTPKHGGGQPDAPKDFNKEWIAPELTLYWNDASNVSSYQLVSSEGEDIWEELYSGDSASYTYETPPGKRYYRVRARNARGFSDWSEVLEFTRPENAE